VTRRAVAFAALCLAIGCSGSVERLAVAPPLSLADSLIRLGDSTYREDSDSARRLWERGLSEATLRGDSINVARALTGLGMAARLRGDWDASRRTGEQALAIKQRLGMGPRDLFRSHNALGLLAWNAERLGDATTLFERALENARELNDSIAIGMVTINTGLVLKDLGAFSRSREAFLRGRDIARSQGDSVNLGKALNNLAMLDIALGDPISAIASLEDARRLARLTGDSNTEVNARGQLATAYAALGDPQRAFALLDSALTMAQRGSRRLEVAEDVLLIGDLFFEAGDYQHALDYYQRAHAVTDSIDQPEERGNILRSEAQTLVALGNLAAARDRASDALRLHRDASLRLSELYDQIVLADIAQRDGRPRDADTLLTSAERLASSLDAPIAVTMVAIARARAASQARDWNRVLTAFERARGSLSLVGKSVESEALALRARALAALGRNEAALEAGRLAIEAVEGVRGRYATGELRTSYTSAKADVFSEQALLLLRLGRTSEAFQVADAARGRAVLEHLTQARADLQATPGATPLLEQETLLRRIDALLAQLRERESTPPRERSLEHRAVTAGLHDSVETLRAEYAALVARNAATRNPNRTVFGMARPDASAIQQSLQPGEVLLEYLVTSEKLLIFAVTQSNVAVHTVDERAEQLTSRVQLARDLLRRRESGTEVRAVLRALFDIVLGPVMRSGDLRDTKRIIVVPHGVLTYLPFAALMDSSSQYVAERFVLLHVPTSAALPALRAKSSETRPERASIFAPVQRTLPATEIEAEAVAKVLIGAETLVGNRATEGRFRSALQRGGIVHVATHATLNSRNPLFSTIEFAGGQRGVAANNGRLEAHELLGMRISSPLVFLSGCETAIGGAWSTRFDSGEDYAALAQTLLYAGARNVVATLWRIDDDGAAEFATAFYEALRGDGFAEALAEAQRSFIQNPKYRSPYYWAAYQVSGGGFTSAANTAAVSDKR
jgi:CHAT domain-containing protein